MDLMGGIGQMVWGHSNSNKIFGFFFLKTNKNIFAKVKIYCYTCV